MPFTDSALTSANTVGDWLAVVNRITAFLEANVLLINETTTGNVTLNGVAQFLANTHIGGNLLLNGLATLTGNVEAGGYINAAGSLHIAGLSTLTGNVTFAGFANIAGKLVVAGLSTLTGNVEAGGYINAVGSLQVAGNTALGGNTAITGTLSVTGGNTTMGNLVASLLTAANTTIQGFANITGNLTVAGTATFSGNVGLTGNVSLLNLTVTANTQAGNVNTAAFKCTTLHASGNSSFDGFVNVGSTLEVTSATLLHGLFHAVGNATFDGFANVAGNLNVTGNLNIGGNTTISGNVGLSGNVSLLNLTVAGNSALGNITSTGFANVTGTLQVGGNTTMAGTLQVAGNTSLVNAHATGSLIIDGLSTLTGNAILSGYANIAGDINVAGVMNQVGNATFGGFINVAGVMTQTGNATFAGFINVASSLQVAGLSTLTGNATLSGFANIAGALAVVGLSTLTGNATLSGFANIAGALTVAGLSTLGSLVFSGYEQQAGVITPAQITANTDNYNSAGLNTSRILRANSSAVINLTGLTALTAGTKLTIHNIGAFNIILNHANTSSTAANRFSCPDAADLYIHSGGTADLWYDGLASVWKVYGGNRAFNFVIDGILAVGGNTSANGNLNVAGLSTLTGNTIVGGNLNVSSSVTAAAGVIVPPDDGIISSAHAYAFLPLNGVFGNNASLGMYGNDPSTTNTSPRELTLLNKTQLANANVDVNLAAISNTITAQIGVTVHGGVPNIDFYATTMRLHGDLMPGVNGSYSLGSATMKFAEVHAITITPGDVIFSNRWTLTEHDKVGIAEIGVALLDEHDKLIAFFGKNNVYGNPWKNINTLSYTQTTPEQRAILSGKRPNPAPQPFSGGTVS